MTGTARDPVIVESLVGPVAAPELHVMTFNIRRRIDGPGRRLADRWSTRRPLVQAILRAARPTVLGIQETLPDQAAAICDALGPAFRYVGHGRQAGGRGEANPLFFDTSRLELLEWTQTALSDSPDIAGSTSWGNVIPRALVTATFRDRDTGTRFVAMNTHLDHLSARSRRRAARDIRERVQSRRLPAIVTGDLNARAGSPAIRELFADDALVDTWPAAQQRLTPEWTTYARYRSPRADGRRIDWIAATPDIEVRRAAIDGRRIAGGWASDHLPVHAVIRMPLPGPAS